MSSSSRLCLTSAIYCASLNSSPNTRRRTNTRTHKQQHRAYDIDLKPHITSPSPPSRPASSSCSSVVVPCPPSSSRSSACPRPASKRRPLSARTLLSNHQTQTTTTLTCSPHTPSRPQSARCPRPSSATRVATPVDRPPFITIFTRDAPPPTKLYSSASSLAKAKHIYHVSSTNSQLPVGSRRSSSPSSVCTQSTMSTEIQQLEKQLGLVSPQPHAKRSATHRKPRPASAHTTTSLTSTSHPSSSSRVGRSSYDDSVVSDGLSPGWSRNAHAKPAQQPTLYEGEFEDINNATISPRSDTKVSSTHAGHHTAMGFSIDWSKEFADATKHNENTPLFIQQRQQARIHGDQSSSSSWCAPPSSSIPSPSPVSVPLHQHPTQSWQRRRSHNPNLHADAHAQANNQQSNHSTSTTAHHQNSSKQKPSVSSPSFASHSLNSYTLPVSSPRRHASTISGPQLSVQNLQSFIRNEKLLQRKQRKEIEEEEKKTEEKIVKQVAIANEISTTHSLNVHYGVVRVSSTSSGVANQPVAAAAATSTPNNNQAASQPNINSQNNQQHINSSINTTNKICVRVYQTTPLKHIRDLSLHHFVREFLQMMRRIDMKAFTSSYTSSPHSTSPHSNSPRLVPSSPIASSTSEHQQLQHPSPPPRSSSSRLSSHPKKAPRYSASSVAFTIKSLYLQTVQQTDALSRQVNILKHKNIQPIEWNTKDKYIQIQLKTQEAHDRHKHQYSHAFHSSAHSNSPSKSGLLTPRYLLAPDDREEMKLLIQTTPNHKSKIELDE